MSARSMLLAVLVLVVTSTACQPPVQEEASGALSDADIAAIRQVSETYRQAILAGDWTALSAVFTEDAVWMPPDQPAPEGRAAIQEWFGPLTPLTAFELTALETEGHGGFAYERGRYSITFPAEGMAESVSDTGKYVAILRKQPDGSWLRSLVIWNADQPLGPPHNPQQGSGTEE